MKKGRNKAVKGIRIRTANIGMMAVSCILYIFLIVATVRASYRYDAMIGSMENYVSCEQDANLVKEGSDYLTDQVRLYTVTFDTESLNDYFDEVYNVRRRDTALEHMENFGVTEEARKYLQTALNNSNKLMEQEIYAMKLISMAKDYDLSKLPEDVRNMELSPEDMKLTPDAMIEKARDMVFGSSYRKDKEAIMENVSYFLDTIVNDAFRKQQDSVLRLRRIMKQQQILISVLFIENIFTFFLIILLVIKPLKIYIENIEDKEKLNISGSYEFKYLALTYNNIYELNATNEAMLHYRAEHDPLTGLINRGAFENLKQVLKMKHEPLALMIVDVDKFKSVNDGYGHETGDRVLKKVAKLLEESFRSSDYPARIGGDEFAVILTDAVRDMKPVVEEKVRKMNEFLMHPEDGLPKVSLSVGVAFSEAGFEDELYKKADSALYEVKEHGRCGCRFYEEEEK